MAEISSPASEIDDTLPEIPSTLTILAIDSDLTVLEFIKKACNQHDIQVLACSESQSAVNALQERKERFDFILMEVDMPIMDGIEFLNLLKKEQIDVPLIMMSSSDSEASEVRAFKLGAYDYWIKPLHEIQFKSLWIQLAKKCVIEHESQKNDNKRKAHVASHHQQQQQNDMSLVSGRQIEQQQQHQNDMVEEALALYHLLAIFANIVIADNLQLGS